MLLGRVTFRRTSTFSLPTPRSHLPKYSATVMTNSKHTFVPSFTFVLVHMSYSVAAMLVNVTVDDSAPDPHSGESIVYSPYNDWSIGQNCSTCLARPDASMIYDNSWHDHTYGSPLPSSNQFGSATFYFVGTPLLLQKFCRSNR